MNKRCVLHLSPSRFSWTQTIAAVMPDAEQIQEIAVKALLLVETVSTFAESINPLFKVVTVVAGVARRSIAPKEGDLLDEQFKKIHSKLDSISQKSREILDQIPMNDVEETYGKCVVVIKHQYGAFNEMLENVKKDPEGEKQYKEDFKKSFENHLMEDKLNTYWRGVTQPNPFGEKILEVYFKNCKGDKKIMEAHCFNIAHVFHMGLICLAAYTAIDEDDQDQVQKKWAEKVKQIQESMDEVLSRCRDKSA